MRLAPIMVISLLMSVGTGGPARAARADPISQEKRIASCIHVSARGQVWLERTLWGLRDREGGWIGAEIPNADGSFDLGPLQINSRWVTRIARLIDRTPSQARWWLIHDACFNVEAARWIFLSGLDDGHDYWRAIGRYHSPTVWRQRLYTTSVAARLLRRFGPNVFRSRGWLETPEAVSGR